MRLNSLITLHIPSTPNFAPSNTFQSPNPLIKKDLEVIDGGVRVTLLLNATRDEGWRRLLTSDLSLLRLRVRGGVFHENGAKPEVVRNISILHPGIEYGGGTGSLGGSVGGGIGVSGGNGQTALGKSEKLPLLQVRV